MRFSRSNLIGFLLFLFGPLLGLFGCLQQEQGGETTLAATTLLPAPTLTITMRPTWTAVPSQTPSPIFTATNPTLPTAIPTSTPTPTLSPTPSLTPSPTTTPVDRTCPDPEARPFYPRPVVGETVWPLPAEATPHFWMALPVQLTEEHFRYNEQFPYGWDSAGRYLLHNGLDVIEPLGTPLLAVADGTVVTAGEDTAELYGWRCNWYGQLVAIELDQRWQGQPVYALYGHVLNIFVQVGQRVTAGQPVAEVGFGGVATAAHLHFEVRVGSNEFDFTRNPMLWLQPQPGRGLIAGRLLDPEGHAWHGVPVTAIGRSEGAEYRATWTYLDDERHLINGDEGWAENFVFPDVAPGQYEIYIELQGESYRAQVEVTAGEVSTVELVTVPYKTPTPTPTVTPGPSPTPTPDGTLTPFPPTETPTETPTATAEGG